MPVITEDTNVAAVYPDLLIPQIEGTWHVARTKAQQEKQLALDLRALGIAYFLPLSARLVRRSAAAWTKAKRVQVPIFPGYFFFAGDEDAPGAAYGTNHIWQLIEVRNQSRLVKELFNLQQAVSSNASFGDPEQRLAKGKRVCIVAGPFEGLCGVVEESKPGRLFLNVELLNRTIPLELNDYPVEVLN